MTARKNIAVAVVGLGWMGQAHSRSLIRIPTLFSETSTQYYESVLILI